MEQMKYIKHDDNPSQEALRYGKSTLTLYFLETPTHPCHRRRRLPLTEKLVTLWWSLNC